jgi:hypothetical protein
MGKVRLIPDPSREKPIDAVTFKMPLQHYNQIVKEHNQPLPVTGGNYEVYQSDETRQDPRPTKKIFFDSGGPEPTTSMVSFTSRNTSANFRFKPPLSRRGRGGLTRVSWQFARVGVGMKSQRKPIETVRIRVDKQPADSID